MSTKTNMKNALDHSIPSPKKNQSQNYYSQLLGRTNPHLHSGFMSPQVSSMNSNQQIQNPMLNSLQVPNQLFPSQQQNNNIQIIATSASSSQNIPASTESSKHNNAATHSNNANNTNINNNINNNNNYKLTDILSTRYSSGTLKMMRNGHTSIPNNLRQLSSDARQLDAGGSLHSNSNQDFVHSPANSSKNQNQAQSGGMQNSQVQNSVPQTQSNPNQYGGNVTLQKQQLINKVKNQLTSQQQQKQQQQQQQNNLHHSQNIHSIHGGSAGGFNINSSGIQSSAISPRTFSNLVQDKLIRSKVQNSQQQQQQSASVTGSLKESTKNSLTTTKRPKSLKQIENDHFAGNQNHQQVHEQNMNILASMTMNNRNSSEKNLMRSQQLAGQIIQQNTNQSQQNQYQQHVQSIQASKLMLAQQQNISSPHQSATEQFNSLMIASAKASNNTGGTSSIMNQRYEMNWSKHQTSHSVEKFRGQSESLDMNQQHKQQDTLASQVQKVILNKQQQPKKSSTIIPETSKVRNKKYQESNSTSNYRQNITKKQQNSLQQQNLSHSQQTTIHHLNTLNNQSANSNQNQSQTTSNSNYMLSNYNSAQHPGQLSAPTQSSISNNLSNYNSKQTLSAITQRIQQNLNILNDPIQQNKTTLQQNIMELQHFPSNIPQHKSNNITEFISRVDVDTLQFDIGISNQDKRDHSGKRALSQNQQLISPINSSKTHKQTNSISETNKNFQLNTLQNEEIQQQNYPQQAIQLLINNSQGNQRNYQQNLDQITSNSNTPQGKMINSGYSKQQTHISNKDGAKHQIYFMKEKERGTKKNDFGASKNKRKGEQSTPHSNSQGYPQILMSNSAVNQSSQGQLALSALQKSSGSITTVVNQNLINSNIIKYLNKQSTKNEEEKIFELSGANQVQNTQYSMTDGQTFQRTDDLSKKERDTQGEAQNENIQSGNQHEKRNSLTEGSKVFNKVFTTTEGSYLGDLKQQNNDILPYMSTKNINNYHSNTQSKNFESLKSIQEVNNYQQAQNKSSQSNQSSQKIQQQKHVNPNQNTFASPISNYTQQQNQQFANSFQQSKIITDDSSTSNNAIQDKGKYFQTLFNNLFIKDGKKKQSDRLTNQTQENTLINGSSSHIKNNTEQINNTSQVNEQKQKQLIQTEYSSTDQKLEELPSNVISYNIKNQLKQQNTTDQPLIKTYAASAETTPSLMNQNFNQQSIQSPRSQQSQTLKSSVNVSPFNNQLKSQVLRSGDELIDKLREAIEKNTEIEEDHATVHQQIEYSSLNSSIVQIKNRQSIYVQSDNQLKETHSHPNITVTVADSQNNISFSQLRVENQTNIQKEFKNLQNQAEKILNRYKDRSNQLTQIVKEQNIRISEQNQALSEKDSQIVAIYAQLKDFQIQSEIQKQEIMEKDNFILFLKSQISELVQNPSLNQNYPQQNNNSFQQITQIEKINVINNYSSSPSAVRSNNSLNNYSPQQSNKIYNPSALQNNIQQFGSQYYNHEEPLQHNQCQVRHSLPVFSKGFFGYNQDTPIKSDNCDRSPSQCSQQEEQSADFTGNKDQNPLESSMDSLKKYQVSSINKKQSNKSYQQMKAYQNSQQKNYIDQFGKQNSKSTNSQHKEDQNDPLNDSAKLLQRISKKSQENSSSHVSSRKQSSSYDQHQIKPFQSNIESLKQDKNPIPSQNEGNGSAFYFGNQGSFSNLQELEQVPKYQGQDLLENEKKEKDYRNSEAMTSTTPTNSQNQTLSHQNNQRLQNRLFSTDQEDYHSNRNSANLINPNESFSNGGGACFGGSNEAEAASQTIDNSFGECCFGQQTNNEQNFSQSDISSSNKNNVQNFEQNTFGLKVNSHDIISLSSKSSQQYRNISGNNSPNLNNSFSKKSTPIQIIENCTSNSFQQQNPLNDSFNLNNQKIEGVETATIQFANSSFCQIPLQEEDQQISQNNYDRKQSSVRGDQINISFEGFGKQQEEQQNQNDQQNSLFLSQQHHQVKLNDEIDVEQQQGISFTNQSFG